MLTFYNLCGARTLHSLLTLDYSASVIEVKVVFSTPLINHQHFLCEKLRVETIIFIIRVQTFKIKNILYVTSLFRRPGSGQDHCN